MEINEKDVKKFALIILIVILAILAFITIRPVIFSVLGGLLLAYIFFPVYSKISKALKNTTIAATLCSIFLILILAIPLWFLTPILIQESFDAFKAVQSFDTNALLLKLFPSVSEQIISQLNISISNTLSSSISSILSVLVEYILNFATILLHLILVAFVFFFALKDHQQLRDFVLGLSPLNKTQEEHLKTQFRGMTYSIIHGQFISGILQGILAGIGFIAFGVPGAFILTVLSLILGVIPIVGPGLVYFPVAIYLLATGKVFLGFLFLAYNLIIVSFIDNFLRTHLISKRTKVSQVIVLIGMVGGLFVFGILGILLGPLILAYFLTILKAYKEKTLSSMFN